MNDSISNIINTLSGQSAAWYQGITGKPVLSGVISAGAVTQTGSPTVAAILANPIAVVVVLVGIFALLFLLLRK